MRVPRPKSNAASLLSVIRTHAMTIGGVILRQPPVLQILCRMFGLRTRQIGSFQIVYRPETADEKVIAESFDRDTLFARVSEYKPQRGDTILDAGAYIGDFALLAAATVNPGVVYAVEPGRQNHRIMRLNALINLQHNIYIDRLAFAADSGSTVLYHLDDPWETWGPTTTKALGGSHEVVPTECLSDFIQRRGISRIHFAKFNCEGAEFPVLMGASRETLNVFDILLVLYHANLVSGLTADHLVDHLRENGFDVRIWDREEAHGWLVASRKNG